MTVHGRKDSASLVGGMTNGRRDSLKEAGALARLLLGITIVLDVSILGWLGQNWDASNRLVQAALALVVPLAVAVWLLFETARTIARAMEDRWSGFSRSS